MLRDFSPQALIMGIMIAFVGSFAVVLQGFLNIGATPLEAASGLTMMTIVMGLCGIFLSIKTKLPVSVAWSTPGAALLIGTAPLTGGYSVAVGAFLFAAALTILAGVWRPFGRTVEQLPLSLANAMLAGILMPICFAPIEAISLYPVLGLPIALTWLVVTQFNKVLAIPATLLTFIIVIVLGVELPPDTFSKLAEAAIPQIILITPTFEGAAIISVGLPLFVVTMASQNIPGIAVLKANGYAPAPGPLIATTGFFSVLSAPFGNTGVNLAAITAAMGASEEAHADPAKRNWATIIAGIAYIAIGLLAGIAITFISLAPEILVKAIAGLALISAFSAAASGAFKMESQRPAAAVTFLLTASGVSFFGISGAFWGLIVGIAILSASKIMTQK